ncbi:MAG: hypothetical protein KDC46_05715 [Thermoleophilia bacterium]|nr:hypothetical protein [Thermoleophilia bacterium]
MSTISPTTGALPQYAAPTSMSCGCQQPAPSAAVAGGGPLAGVSTEQLTGLVTAVQGLVDAVRGLVSVLSQQAPAASGGGASLQGAAAAPDAPASLELASSPTTAPSGATATAGSPPRSARPPAPSTSVAGGGSVDPSTVKDKASTKGLKAPAARGLEVAHSFGLPLVSGHRSGGAPNSDHPKGLAIDVSQLAIGSASSTQGTEQMQAYAEYMRQQGKAGKLDVKYVIHNGRIASATNDWAWRDYTYPGKTQASLAALKQSNRGEYNRLQHYDHVHVSFNG